MTAEPRLYVESDLAAGADVALSAAQAHYLCKVMRLGPGAALKLFNGRDGEWRAALTPRPGQGVCATPQTQLRPQTPEPDLWLLFAPVKGRRIEAIAEKAGELGVSEIRPVVTERTIVRRVNMARLVAHAREAAEQCERLTAPLVRAPVKLAEAVADWPVARGLLFADERADAEPVARALGRREHGGAWAVLIGPEGGFTPAEKQLVRALPQTVPVSLGPRLLRADTAAFAALSVWQAHLGDWRCGDAGAG